MHPSDDSAFFAIKANPIYSYQACRYILHSERMQKKTLDTNHIFCPPIKCQYLYVHSLLMSS